MSERYATVHDSITGEIIGEVDQDGWRRYVVELAFLSRPAREAGVVKGDKYGFPGKYIFILED